MTIRSQLLAICLCCSTAYALGGDNTHPQGVRLAGRGFDESETGQASKPVPFVNTSTWPLPQNGVYELKVSATRTLKIRATCPPDPPGTGPFDRRFQLCSGTIEVIEKKDGKAPSTKFCDSDDATKESVPLLAIHARWRTPGEPASGLQFGDFVTFACSPVFPKGAEVDSLGDLRMRTARMVPDLERNGGVNMSSPVLKPEMSVLPSTAEGQAAAKPGSLAVAIGAKFVTPGLLIDLSNIDRSTNLGVLAKCYFWGFVKGQEFDDGLLTYQACVRAARADYCGDGVSQTEPGTIIQIYETPESMYTPLAVNLPTWACKPTVPAWTPCFEAIWTERKASCVSHTRYKHLTRTCRKEFRKTIEFLGKEKTTNDVTLSQKTLHCVSSDYNALATHSRVKNRSGINDITTAGVDSCSNDILCP